MHGMAKQLSFLKTLALKGVQYGQPCGFGLLLILSLLFLRDDTLHSFVIVTFCLMPKDSISGKGYTVIDDQ